MQLRMGRCNKSFEQGVGLIGLAQKFRMELRRDKKWMIGQLDDFGEFSIRRIAADDETCLLELFHWNIWSH